MSSRVKLSSLKSCMPLEKVENGLLVSKGRRDSWPALSHTWRLMGEGPDYEPKGTKERPAPMFSIVEVAYGASEVLKSAFVTAVRTKEPLLWKLAVSIALDGQQDAAIVDGTNLIKGHRRAAAIAVGMCVKAMPLAFLIAIETAIDRRESSTVPTDKAKKRKPGEKKADLDPAIAKTRAEEMAKIFTDSNDSLVVEQADKKRSALGWNTDDTQYDGSRIDEGFKLLQLPEAGAGKKANITTLARQAQTMLGMYGNKSAAAAYQIVRQRYVVARSATVEEVSKCREGADKAFSYDKLADRYGVGFKAKKPDLYFDFPVSAKDLQAALEGGEGAKTLAEVCKWKVSDGKTVTVKSLFSMFNETEIRKFFGLFIRVETSAQRAKRTEKVVTVKAKKGESGDSPSVSGDETGAVQKAPHARSGKARKVG